jgi:topoisomerase IV subunit A
MRWEQPKFWRLIKLTEVQADAILNMRLRSLRRLEEMEIRREHKALAKEHKDISALLKDAPARWKRIAEEIAETRKKFSEGPLGTRRTLLAGAPAAAEIRPEALIEREPVTVVLSERGWLRALKGHVAPNADIKSKDGDRLKFLVPCQTTDKLCIFGTNGRAYTIRADDLPRGRGEGQPLRTTVELTNEDDAAALFVATETGRFLVGSSTGRGFLVPAAELSAEKRTGKTILVLKPGEEAAVCVPADGDHVAVIGDNRKLLVFPIEQVPEMTRGTGVILQRYKDGGLRDAKVFRRADGLSWRLGERTRTETDLRAWLGERAQAGRLPPNGFPRSGRFE